MRDSMNKDLKYFNPMKLREKYSVGSLNKKNNCTGQSYDFNI